MWILLAALGVIALWLVLIHGFILPQVRKNKVLRSVQDCPAFLLTPLPQELDKPVQVAGRDHTPLLHQINLFRLTCTCRRFRTRRGFFPQNDIRRLCFHLRQEMGRQHLLEHFDALSQCIIQDRVRDKCYVRSTILGTDVGFGITPSQDFMRIFARHQDPSDPPEGPFTGPYNKFSFHINRKTWIYDESPPGAELIIERAMNILNNANLNNPTKSAAEEAKPAS
ncbi:MAG: hypothetical protein H7833_19060 [Magnetococcus sp. DMHC-1]|nr:hypothetical protein [Magnetococcales bacterium]